jgi:UDP-galactopyranose mutase
LGAIEHLIIGAGLSGLSAAHHLEKKGRGDWLVIEKSGRAGGLCKSVRHEDGFTFDHSIHILYSSDPYASELIRGLLDGNMIVQERESWVFSNGMYTPYPWQANTHGLPAEVVRECLMGVIEATYKRDDERAPANFEEWCYATFGKGLAEHFMIPYNRKQWAVDLRLMTDAWIRDRVMTPSLDEVIAGALHRQERRFGPNSVFWYPESGGIEALPKGLMAGLDQDKILLNTEIRKVFWREKKVACADGREWRYERLISSIPLPLLAVCMEPELCPELKEAAGRLESNTVLAVNLAVKREKISPHHWVYFPEDKYLLHRVSFPNNFSEAMAPNGWSSITVEVSTSRHRPVPGERKLVETVLAELKEAKVILDGDVTEVRSVLHLSPAYVIYTHTHRGDVDGLHRFLKENEIFPCGRFGEWEYLNMDHSILSGKAAVE